MSTAFTTRLRRFFGGRYTPGSLRKSRNTYSMPPSSALSGLRAQKMSDDVLLRAASCCAVVMSAISERQRSTRIRRCSPSGT